MLKDLLCFGRESKLPCCIDRIEDLPALHIIRLKGRVDMLTIPKVELLIGKAEEKRGLLNKNILVDFKDVNHVDSSTIAMLLMALSEIKHHMHKLALINIDEKLKDMFDILKVRELFSVYESEEAALNDLE